VGILDPIRAADYAFAQRIIPVLRGRGSEFQEVMGDLVKILKANRLTRSAEHIERAIKKAEFGEIDLLGY
jgi:hypothetical protein